MHILLPTRSLLFCGFWATHSLHSVGCSVSASTESLSWGSSIGWWGHAWCWRHGAPSRPVPAAKQESKWKSVTYRKLCEARLSLEATDELTIPTLETDAKLIGNYFGRKPSLEQEPWYRDKLMQNVFLSLRPVWVGENSEWVSFWCSCRNLHRPYTSSSFGKQWTSCLHAVGQQQGLLGIWQGVRPQLLDFMPSWLMAMEGCKDHQFQLLLLQAKHPHQWSPHKHWTCIENLCSLLVDCITALQTLMPHFSSSVLPVGQRDCMSVPRCPTAVGFPKENNLVKVSLCLVALVKTFWCHKLALLFFPQIQISFSVFLHGRRLFCYLLVTAESLMCPL